MALDAKVEASQPVPTEGVGSTLQHNRIGSKDLHGLANDRTEYTFVTCIVHSIVEWKIDSVAFPLCISGVKDVARAGKEVSMLMEAHGHDAIGGIERLLHPI
eukprot:CAMPEP_0113299606 /NCGR_PEP_ID=MMETSP0010_2-20120614/1573_1 /TAXON_ID=216773 ORGANISM="Corethron hystrix, Strain 308" /NCGR_SAMPLE_ID=MMETSP0010_2 /ASSEMBLY_ACC=CAM_ASM_000155 /LENGTH=101 /DNA_ID=CAMNT_0000152873 /DNA_START=1089 /DNA_END=1391 /DNA_ORIENTATION=- /assembly_acc=CAM_ASM_000155